MADNVAAAAAPAPAATPEGGGAPLDVGASAPKGNGFVEADPAPAEAAAKEAADKAAGAGLILGKFKDQAALEEAYKALETKLGTPAAAEGDAQSLDKILAAGPDGKTPPAASGKVDMAAISAEYARDGKLAESTYKLLDNAGFDKATVDSYIAGNKALAEQETNQLMSKVGGAESYQKVVQWASKNLSAAEIAAFNSVVSTGDPRMVEFAVDALQAKHKAAEGTKPNLVNAAGRGGAVGYQSVAEMTKDMNDPRYLAGDRNFHAAVDRRLMASSKNMFT